MAVTYMLELEKEPNSYEKHFTQLTKGVNLKVQECIQAKVPSGARVLEVGCGPGNLARQLAEKGCQVLAIDINPAMISYNNAQLTTSPIHNLTFKVSNGVEICSKFGKFDVIISTFMLSEIRPFEQQQFLRSAWNQLAANGRLIIAEEFAPKEWSKIGFALKRWFYRLKLKRQRLGTTHPLTWFTQYLDPIGFSITDQQKWRGSIQGLDLCKKTQDLPGSYQPRAYPYEGLKAWMRSLRCLITGQIDHIAIEPGLYQMGNPTPDSPVIVTANYEYTYFRVMRDLRGLDLWVLCVDSNGINVWCGARGGNFGNKQLLEAVKATQLEKKVKISQLILPQLAAGGVSVPELPKQFPFRIKFGPIWSKDLKTYLKDPPKKKPESMRLAIFNWSKRIEAGVTHTTFLWRMFLIVPTFILAVIFLGFYFGSSVPLVQRVAIFGLQFLCWIWFAIGLMNVILIVFFPIVNFTRRFIIKGLILGIINMICGMLIFWYWFESFVLTIASGIFLYWLGIFVTMSYSGYTMATGITEIRHEYARFVRINSGLFFASVIAYIIGLIWEVWIWTN